MSDVFFITTIDTKSIEKLVDKLQLGNILHKDDFVAVKIHFGEKGNLGFVKPEYVRPIIRKIKSTGASPFLTDASTLYSGERGNAITHLNIAYGHGFKFECVECPVIIADGLRGNTYVEIDIKDCCSNPNLKKVKIANAIHYSDSIVAITHFKGHCIFGVGGVLKNIGMGCAAKTGKYELHNTLLPKIDTKKCIGCGKCIKLCSADALSLDDNKLVVFKANKCIGCGECIQICKQGVFKLAWDESVIKTQEKTVEYVYGVLKNKKIVCINFLNYITKNCDCMAMHEKPLLDDIGILASIDPVAIDQASVDLVNKKYGSDLFKEVFPELDCNIHIKYAEKLGLGSRKYNLVTI